MHLRKPGRTRMDLARQYIEHLVSIYSAAKFPLLHEDEFTRATGQAEYLEQADELERLLRGESHRPAFLVPAPPYPQVHGVGPKDLTFVGLRRNVVDEVSRQHPARVAVHLKVEERKPALAQEPVDVREQIRMRMGDAVELAFTSRPRTPCLSSKVCAPHKTS